MRRETSNQSDQLSFREPVGAGGWFGVPIVLVAAGFTVAAAIALLTQPAAASPGMAAILLLFPAALTFIVVQMVRAWLVRIGTTLDRRAGTVTTEWGVLTPMFSKTWPLGDFDHLRIGFAFVTRGSSVPTMRTILTLAGPTGEILIGRHDQDAPIVRMAEDVSGFLGMDIKDVRKGYGTAPKPPEPRNV